MVHTGVVMVDCRRYERNKRLRLNGNVVYLAPLRFILITSRQLRDTHLWAGRRILSCQTSVGFVDILGV